MKTFTIENENNNITLHASGKEAEMVPDSERFSNEAALAKLAANWPAARLVDIWNSLPGATPVKKFKDRATAVSRIWKALQSLGEAAPAVEEAAPVPEVTPEAEAQANETAQPEASETVQPEAVMPESTEPALLRPLRHKRPTWRRWSLPRPVVPRLRTRPPEAEEGAFRCGGC